MIFNPQAAMSALTNVTSPRCTERSHTMEARTEFYPHELHKHTSGRQHIGTANSKGLLNNSLVPLLLGKNHSLRLSGSCEASQVHVPGAHWSLLSILTCSVAASTDFQWPRCIRHHSTQVTLDIVRSTILARQSSCFSSSAFETDCDTKPAQGPHWGSIETHHYQESGTIAETTA